MLAKQYDADPADDMPVLDEGWWAAVLADEDTLQQPVVREVVPARPMAQPSVTGVDWQWVQELFEQDEVITLQVYGFNRGGVLVQGQGIQGFVPISHLVDMPSKLDDQKRRQLLSGYVGQSLELKVIECEPTQERVVLSERAAQAGEGRRKQVFDTLHCGQCVTGTVTNVTEFGAFIDLGGVEGLIHVSELSWGRVHHPSDVLQVGQQVEALVLQIVEESSRVALSLKRMHANPWETLGAEHRPGDVLAATITAIMRFGAFARLEQGVEGLIHQTSMNMPPHIRDIDQFLHPGQRVKVCILHIDIERRRLGLKLVQVE